jgi:hypothetical protein
MTLREKLWRWIATGAIESAGVGLGAISGLLIVNMLPKSVYAEYTFLVACTMLLVGLSDMGLGHCYLPIVGERHQDRHWVFGACQRIYRRRWQLFVIAAVIVVPYWLYISLQHAWVAPGYVLASLIIIPVTLVGFREGLMSSIIVILGRVMALNRINGLASVFRLGLVLLALFFISDNFVIVGLLAATLGGSAVALMLATRESNDLGFHREEMNEDERKTVDKEITRILRPIIIPTLFYQFQSVITIFLISLLGAASMLAEVGALTKIGLVLTIVDRVVSLLVFPPIARTPRGPGLVKLIVRTHVIYLMFMGALFSTAWFLPQYWILLVGKQYSDSANLVWMAFLPAILMNGAGFAYSTLTTRGETSKQIYIIPAVLAVQVIYVLTIGVDQTRLALGFAIASAAAYFLYQYTMLSLRLKKLSLLPV